MRKKPVDMATARDIVDRRTAQAMLGIDDSREFDHLVQRGVLVAIDPTEYPVEAYRRADVEALVPTIRPRALARSQERMAQAERLKRRQPDQVEILKRRLAAQERDAEERKQGRLEFIARMRAAEPPMVAPGPREQPPYNPLSYFERSVEPEPLSDIPGLVRTPGGGYEAPGWTRARPPPRPIKRPRPDLVRIDEAYGLFDEMPQALIDFGVSQGILQTVTIDDGDGERTCWFALEFVQSLLADPAMMKACARHLIDVRDNDMPRRPFRLTKPTPTPPDEKGVTTTHTPSGDQPLTIVSPAPPASLPTVPTPKVLEPATPTVPEPVTPQETLAYLFRAPLDVPNNAERSTWDWITDACGTERRYMAQDILIERGYRVLHAPDSIKLVIGYEHPYLVALAKRAGWRPRLLRKRLRQLSPVSFGRFDFRYNGKRHRCRGIVISIEASDAGR